MGALSLWRPFRDLERLARNWESRFPRFSQEFEEAEKEFAPPVECYVKDGSLVVRADVPGLEPKDIEINVLENVLTIKGERKSEQEIKKEKELLAPRSFVRRLRAADEPAGGGYDRQSQSHLQERSDRGDRSAGQGGWGKKDTTRGRVGQQDLARQARTVAAIAPLKH
jgi:HSP20 family protein